MRLHLLPPLLLSLVTTLLARPTTNQQLPLDGELYASPNPIFAGRPITLSSSTSKAGPGRYALAYTPYTSTGHCRPRTQVEADLRRIRDAGFSAVRLQAPDCSVLAAAESTSLRLILGVFVGDGGVTDEAVSVQVDAILAWAASGKNKERIDAVIVGNEAVFNGYASAAEMAGLVRVVRRKLRKVGYEGSVSAVEPFAIIVKEKKVLCPAIDVVAANLLPFFDGGVSAGEVGGWIEGRMRVLHSLCPQREDEEADRREKGSGTYKHALAMEVGWPSRGTNNGKAWPGKVEQRVALKTMEAAVGGGAVFSSFGDDEWREAGDFGVETHWGAIDVFE